MVTAAKPSTLAEPSTLAAGDDLAGLVQEAAGIDAESDPGRQQAAAEEAQAAAGAEEAGELVDLLASLVVPMLPDRYAARYDDKAVAGIRRAWVALCLARGWDAASILGRWGPELALAAAVLGPALPVIIADAKARKAARVQQEPAPAPAPAPAPGQYVRKFPAELVPMPA